MNKREKAELRTLGKSLKSGHRKGGFFGGVEVPSDRPGYRKFSFGTSVVYRKKTPKKPRKNFLGFGSGTPRSQVERQKKKAAHAALDRGDHREARRISKMSTRRFAKKRGIKVEGRFRGKVRSAKDRARAKAHGIIDRIFGGKPSQKNPIPALLGSLGQAIEQGAGYATGAALGTEAFKDLERRKRVVKKKKKATGRRPQATAKHRKPKKKNPARRRHISFAQAVARIRRAGRERGAKAVKIKV